MIIANVKSGYNFDEFKKIIPRIKIAPTNNNYFQVLNMGYAKINEHRVVLSCFIGDCRFKTYSADNLQRHFNNFHDETNVVLKKDGLPHCLCFICDNYECGVDLNDELKHMMEHIENRVTTVNEKRIVDVEAVEKSPEEVVQEQNPIDAQIMIEKSPEKQPTQPQVEDEFVTDNNYEDTMDIINYDVNMLDDLSIRPKNASTPFKVPDPIVRQPMKIKTELSFDEPKVQKAKRTFPTTEARRTPTTVNRELRSLGFEMMMNKKVPSRRESVAVKPIQKQSKKSVRLSNNLNKSQNDEDKLDESEEFLSFMKKKIENAKGKQDKFANFKPNISISGLLEQEEEDCIDFISKKILNEKKNQKSTNNESSGSNESKKRLSNNQKSTEEVNNESSGSNDSNKRKKTNLKSIENANYESFGSNDSKKSKNTNLKSTEEAINESSGSNDSNKRKSKNQKSIEDASYESSESNESKKRKRNSLKDDNSEPASKIRKSDETTRSKISKSIEESKLPTKATKNDEETASKISRSNEEKLLTKSITTLREETNKENTKSPNSVTRYFKKVEKPSVAPVNIDSGSDEDYEPPKRRSQRVKVINDSKTTDEDSESEEEVKEKPKKRRQRVKIIENVQLSEFYPKQIKTTTNSATNEQYSNLKELYPWIDEVVTKSVFKSKSSIEVLLSDNCLFSTYKCMSESCKFYTTSFEDFRLHLLTHIEANSHFCCFCLSSLSKPSELISHIDIKHRNDRFQCNKCMYRACQKGYVDLHQKKFHPLDTCEILKSPVQKLFKSAMQRAEQEMLRNREQFVLPYRCKSPRCKEIYFYKANFKRHLDSEMTKNNGAEFTTMIKEQLDEIDHTKTTNNIEGNTQCLFCKFGTDSDDIISHMAFNHQSEFAYVCKRVMPSFVVARDTLQTHTKIEFIGKHEGETKNYTGDLQDLIYKAVDCSKDVSVNNTSTN